MLFGNPISASELAICCYRDTAASAARFWSIGRSTLQAASSRDESPGGPVGAESNEQARGVTSLVDQAATERGRDAQEVLS